MFLVNKALDCFGYGVARLLGLEYTPLIKPKPTIPPLLPNPFNVGDLAVLKDKNPWKGCLKGGNAYQVMRVAGWHIALTCENGTESFFDHTCFNKLDYDPDPPGAREYDEIMSIQELME